MENNFEEDYSKYIISEDTKYGFSEEGIFSVSGFNKGGLINKHKFYISRINSDDSSWIYDVNGYQSLTGDNDNAYVIGKSAYLKTDIYIVIELQNMLEIKQELLEQRKIN